MAEAGRPLTGLRVVVTRAAAQADELAAAFAAAGAEVAFLPLLAVLPPEDPAPLAEVARELAEFTWIAFTSANAVTALLAAAGGSLPPHLQMAAVGEATARALAARGIESALVAAEPSGAGLANQLLARLAADDRVLLPQAADARPELLQALLMAGVTVAPVVAYRKVMPVEAPALAAAIFRHGPLGWVSFTSSSAVSSFASLFGPAWPERRRSLRAVAIGPTTAEALRQAGVEPAALAAQPSAVAMVDAMVLAATGHGVGDVPG